MAQYLSHAYLPYLYRGTMSSRRDGEGQVFKEGQMPNGLGAVNWPKPLLFSLMSGRCPLSHGVSFTDLVIGESITRRDFI